MSQTEYERLLLEKSKDKMQFDAFECKGAKLTNIDKNKVKEFLKLLKDSRLTNVAILMFGKDPQEGILSFSIKMIL